MKAGARRETREARERQFEPGRVCPTAYRYSPKTFDREAEIVADTVYVVGGLYGNVEALEALRALAAREHGPVTLVFNGDFHWFDVAPGEFARLNREVLEHWALRGNVETEIATEDSGAGCGCAYPLDVSDAEVSRSNEILERLRATARDFPGMRERLAALPMHLVAQVGEARIGIVHGDAASLAGWGFARDRLDHPSHRRWIESAFRDARVDAFASTHTCLPAVREFEFDGKTAVVANNGAAGMPNFSGTTFGLVTRIGRKAFPGPEKVEGVACGAVHVEALKLAYHHDAWVARFLANWPAGSPAHDSYFRRIVDGPRLCL
jgi:calcineurin-like phosphoesterase family protein